MRRILLSMALIASFTTSTGAYASSPKEEPQAGIKRAEYVKMDPLILPIIDGDGVMQTLSLVIAIEVDGVFSADKVKAQIPRLKDAYIQDMYGNLNHHTALKNGVVQIGFIKDRLNKITDEIVGDKIDTNVLIQVVQQRQM